MEEMSLAGLVLPTRYAVGTSASPRVSLRQNVMMASSAGPRAMGAVGPSTAGLVVMGLSAQTVSVFLCVSLRLSVMKGTNAGR